MAQSADYATEFYQRAEELRTIAELVHDNHNREILLKCAAGYEKLAAQYKKATAQSGRFGYPPKEFLPGFTTLTPAAKPVKSPPKIAPRRGPSSRD